MAIVDTPMVHKNNMKTLITELFHIQYPVICSGMTGVSRPKLVATGMRFPPRKGGLMP